MSTSFAQGVSVDGMMSGLSMLNKPAEEYVNTANVEEMWAMKASQFADIHYNLIISCKPSLLSLTRADGLIYSEFIKDFPNFELGVIDINSLKSQAAKEKWRKFSEKMKEIVEDYSFGTLLRINSQGEYSEDNTILAVRAQFYAIEIARNRNNHNDYLYYSQQLKQPVENN